jgi:PleD family two-component response regulator
LLDDTEAEAAGIALQRISVAVEQAGVEVRGRVLSFGFSAGLASHLPAEPADLLLERADRALYRAKTAGRDQVVQADVPPP